MRPDEMPPPLAISSPSDERLQAIKEEHPRAYEKWTPEEDEELLSLHAAATPLSRLVTHFQRQPSAVRSRLAKLSPGSEPKPS